MKRIKNRPTRRRLQQGNELGQKAAAFVGSTIRGTGWYRNAKDAANANAFTREAFKLADGYIDKGLGKLGTTSTSLFMGKKAEKILTAVEPLLDPISGSTVSAGAKAIMNLVTQKNDTKVDFQGPVKSRTFISNYTAGKKTTKSLLNCAAQNGTKTHSLFNTLTNADFKDPTKAHKEYCELVTGFNQKLLYVSKYFTPQWNDVFNIYKVNLNETGDTTYYSQPNQQDKSLEYRIYGGLLNVSSSLRFRNNMSTTACKFKVHIVASKKRDPVSMNYEDIMASVTAPNINRQVLDEQKIYSSFANYPRPYKKDASGNFSSDTTDSHAIYSLVTPSSKLTDSEEFNDRYVIIKTFARTLDVGDELLLNLRYNFGSGIRLDRALSLKQETGFDRTLTPKWVFPWHIIVELCGPSVTAESSDDNLQDKFIGSAPVSLSWEANHRVSYVLESNSGVPSDTTGTNFTSRVGGPLVRYYLVDDPVTEKPFNVSYFDSLVKATPDVKIKYATTATTQSLSTIT